MLPEMNIHLAEADECQSCPYNPPCVTTPPPGQAGHRISSWTALECVCKGLTPQGSIRQLIRQLQMQVRSAADALYGRGSGARITGGLQNVRGDWLEYILGVIFWNTIANSQWSNTAIVRLPSSIQLEYYRLYEDQARSYLEDLFASLQAHTIKLTMSNPDFVCITNLPNRMNELINSPIGLDIASFQMIDDFYIGVTGICNADSIPFAITVKTSIRPDRRYQIVHEANVVKALVAHLASRFWNPSLYTAFYAMVANRVNMSDHVVLRNPATHTITHVSWMPTPLVDRVFEIDSAEEVSANVNSLLESHLSG